MNRIVTAAALATALWAFKRWLDDRHARSVALPHETDSWENEGGALARYPAGVETSQYPH